MTEEEEEAPGKGWAPGWEGRNQDIIRKLEGISYWIERSWERRFAGRDADEYPIRRKQWYEEQEDAAPAAGAWQGSRPRRDDAAPWED